MKKTASWATVVIALIVLGFLDNGYEEKDREKVKNNLNLYDSFSANGENFSCDEVESIEIKSHTYSASDVVFYLKSGDRIYTSLSSITWHSDKED